MDETPQQQTTRNLVIPLNMPIAIIVAGALIAAAIFFGGGVGDPSTGNNQLAGNTGTGNQPAAAPEPQQPTIGDYMPVDENEDHIRGASDASITLIEYSDLECPFCKQFHPTVAQALDEFPNDVRLVYRHFPLEAIHPNARIAAIGSECAAEQGRFWEFVDYVFESTDQKTDISEANLPETARQAGVTNIAAFESCLSSGKYEDKIDAHTADAQAAGGRGTPYTLVVSESGEESAINGAQGFTAVKAAIEELL